MIKVMLIVIFDDDGYSGAWWLKITNDNRGDNNKDDVDNVDDKNKQLLDYVEQNIVICQWRADSLFTEAKG